MRIFLSDFEFLLPQYLWGSLLLIAYIIYYIVVLSRFKGTLRFSSNSLFDGLKLNSGLWKRYFVMSLKILSLVFILMALARPQQRSAKEKVYAEGIDIILCIDNSGSMRAEDFKPNRLEAVKIVAQKFISERKSDRIGLTTFAGESFLQCPLTTDLSRVNTFVADIKITPDEFDGTAIGLAIAGGINRLRNSEAKSKIIILLSDGQNNAGEINPETASEMAKQFGIKIYTIGIGKEGEAPMPVKTAFGTQMMNVAVNIDEKTLTEIAQKTGGQYFRATNSATLTNIYDEISKLEKTEFIVEEYVKYKELFYYPLAIALLLMLLALLLQQTIFRSFP